MTQEAAKQASGHVIDLSADEFSAAVSAVTSAFGDPTRRDIYLFVRAGKDGVTAAEVAERFDLHPNVARHHLEKLTAGGYLTVELARHETAGRPSKRYRAGELDTSLNFPPRRDDLLATLLARALEMLDPDEAAAMAEEVGYDYGLAIAARMTPEADAGAGHRSVRAALATVADALTAHGFAAHADASGGTLQIVAEQCPFGDAAKKYPHVVCSVDRGMIRGMLAGLYGDTHPLFTESRPAGDDHCVATV
jgi:predicted ArsR family transcriptional regulator